MPQKKGGRVPTGSAIGATMFRRMQKDKRTKRSDAGLGFHVADLELSSNPLQSVTQASSMEEFMAVAAMSERDFTAERGQLTFVEDVRGSSGGGGAAPPPGARGGSFGPVTTPRLLETPSGTIRNLQIPRRPRWDGKSPEELARAEKDAFLEWRREVARAELAHGGGLSGVEDGVEVATVTPFEKNIDVWRQLWRVVERCDVLVQIVDARNPLLYRCPDLEDYVREVNPLKRCLLLINKADYLTHAQRAVWAKHLSALGVRYIFFSARREQLALEELDRQQQGVLPEFSNVVETIPLPSDIARAVPPPSLEAARSRGAAGARAARAAAAVATMWEVLADDDGEEEEEKKEEGEEKVRAKISAASPIVAVAPPAVTTTKTEHVAAATTPMVSATTSSSNFTVCVAFDDPARILTRDELLDFLVEEYKDLPRGVLGSSVEVARRNRADKTARDRVAARAARREELTRRRELNERLISAGLGAHVRFGDEADVAGGAIDSGGESLDEEEEEEVPPLQIGMVGYPNVGKSSTINALTGATAMRHGSQRVAVASTPGKTKHFQTITLNDDITLCDW
jgi:ribosome biogenesis GTPase A